MSNINQVDASQVLSQYSTDRLNNFEEKDDKNQFLELMIAQLENQNPLEPKDGAEFLSQLAQFSTVDGIERLNDNMSTMNESFRSSQALQATALVGRQVSVLSEYGQLNTNDTLDGVIELPSSRSNVNVDIYSITGELVKSIPLGTHPGGNVSFSWDGMSDEGVRMPPGKYEIVASSSANSSADGEAEQFLTHVAANVDSVTLDRAGAVTLNINGIGSVSLSDVKEIN